MGAGTTGRGGIWGPRRNDANWGRIGTIAGTVGPPLQTPRVPLVSTARVDPNAAASAVQQWVLAWTSDATDVTNWGVQRGINDAIIRVVAGSGGTTVEYEFDAVPGQSVGFSCDTLVAELTYPEFLVDVPPVGDPALARPNLLQVSATLRPGAADTWGTRSVLLPRAAVGAVGVRTFDIPAYARRVAIFQGTAAGVGVAAQLGWYGPNATYRYLIGPNTDAGFTGAQAFSSVLGAPGANGLGLLVPPHATEMVVTSDAGTDTPLGKAVFYVET